MRVRHESRRKAAIAAATATALVLLSGLAGCTPQQAPGPLLQVVTPSGSGGGLGDEESNFEGRLLQVALEGLVTGASEQGGAAAYGNLLSVLGWGSDADAGHYKEMRNTLNDIKSGVSRIETEVAELNAALAITEKEILLNANDPKEAISDIITFNDELTGLSQTSEPGQADQKRVLKLADDVQNGLVVEKAVTRIAEAIRPHSVSKPVLDNYTSLLIQRMSSSDTDLKGACIALETYFSELLYYQLQGVTLVVEAKTALAKNGTPDVTSADYYYTHFKADTLVPEVQSFMDNTWRLIAARGSLAHTAGFLPAEAQTVAARAEFLREQALGTDPSGLRAHAVVTSNHTGELTTATARGSDGSSYKAKDTSTTTVSGPVYDSWKGAKVSPSTDYQVVTFDFGAVPAGTYTIEGAAGFAPAAVEVRPYTADYAPDAAGKILYGCALGHTRTGAVEAFAAGAGGAGRTWKHGGSSNVSLGGSLAADKITASGHETNDKFTGEIQVDYRFTFGGSKAATVTIPSRAHAVGSAVTAAQSDLDSQGSATATVTATMGVWDATAGKVVGLTVDPGTKKLVSATSSWSAKASQNQSANADWRPQNNEFIFVALPSHAYTVYFTVSASGSANDGSATAKLALDSMKGMQVQF